MGWVAMSERELGRIEVLSRVVEGCMSVAHAAEVLGLSPRQVQRLLRTFREDGAPALRHKARGRPSNNRLRDGVRDLALVLVRESYADFGPTLAAEKLAERHGFAVSRETLRTWMTQDGLWRLKAQHERKSSFWSRSADEGSSGRVANGSKQAGTGRLELEGRGGPERPANRLPAPPPQTLARRERRS